MSSTAASVAVAAGVLRDADGRVLLARRADDAHQGGLWEFPGGKQLEGEEPRAALQRELAEELGIEVVSARPLIRVRHAYTDLDVTLDTWLVESWRGDVRGLEGQPLAWVHVEDLGDQPMPAADRPIINAIRLPTLCLVTPEPDSDRERFLEHLQHAVSSDIGMVQLRAPALSPADYLALAERSLAICTRHDVRLIVNLPAGLDSQAALALGVHGVHLGAARLRETSTRPVPATSWLSAACHDAGELAHAQHIGCDFVLLSPVCSTLSHPDATPLGWQRFAQLVDAANCPVYALGGMHRNDCTVAWQAGGQGVAAISALWPESAD